MRLQFVVLITLLTSLSVMSYAVPPLTTDFTQAEEGEAFPGGATSQKHHTNRQSFINAFAQLPLEERLNFELGKAIFEKLWVFSPSSTTASDGLGPLYNARSCARCHRNNGRGIDPALLSNEPKQPALVSLLLRLSRADDGSENAAQQLKYQGSVADPMYGTQLQGFAWPNGNREGQVRIDYEYHKKRLNGEAPVTLRKPTFTLTNLGFGPLHPETTIGPRLTPPIIGLGLVDAINTGDLVDLSDPTDVNNDGISGRLNRVWNPIEKKITYGRFGWKASAASLKQQNLAALNNDIGISSRLFPDAHGDCTQAQSNCRRQPTGNTTSQDGYEASNEVSRILNYFVKHLAVPVRYQAKNVEVLAGKKHFYDAGCTGCHQPSYILPKAENTYISEQNIWPYSDFLLHDMGPQLADKMGVFDASGSEWRTPPLWGIGLTKAVSGNELYLHDGRARNLLEAILWHGGEATAAKQLVVDMTPTERQQLITFLESL